MEQIPKPKMTMDRAARRYSQIAALEAQVLDLESEIARQKSAAAEINDTLDELRKKRGTLLVDMRAAARDEGELPLILLMDSE